MTRLRVQQLHDWPVNALESTILFANVIRRGGLIYAKLNHFCQIIGCFDKATIHSECLI